MFGKLRRLQIKMINRNEIVKFILILIQRTNHDACLFLLPRLRDLLSGYLVGAVSEWDKLRNFIFYITYFYSLGIFVAPVRKDF